MADKELGITITGDMSDAESVLSRFVDMLNDLVDKVINIDINADTSRLEGVSTELATLDNEVINTVVNVDDESILEASNNLDHLGDAGAAAAADLQSSMDKATISVADMGNVALDAGNKAEQVGVKAFEAGNTADTSFTEAAAVVAILTAGLEAAAENTEELNIKFSKLSNTAGSIPEENMRDLVADLSNAHFKSDEVLTYITLLKQMGVTSEESLKNGAEAMNQMRIATNANEETIKRFANSLVVMGVPLDDLPSSFNAIAYAQANVVGGFETYVNWMQRYDSKFKELGLNIDQSAVLIAAATKKFGGGRAAYSGLNSALEESNGNLSVLEQRLGMQPGALSHASEMTAQYTGKIDRNTESVHEHTTKLQDLGDVLADLQVRYGDVIGELAQTGAVIGGLAGLFGLIIPKILGYFDELWGSKTLVTYQNWTSKIFSSTKTFGGNILNTIKGWMGWGDEAAKAGNSVNMRLAGEIDNPTILARVKNFGGNVLGNIKSWMGWGDEGGKATINLSRAVEGGFELKPSILQKITGFTVGIGDTLKAGLNAIKIPGLPALDGILTPISKIAGKIAIPITILLGILEAFWHGADLYNQNIITAFLDLLGIDDILKAIGMGESWENFKNWINGYIGTIRDFTNFIYGTKIGDMLGQFLTDMQNIMQSTIDLSSVGGFFGSLVDLFVTPFRDIYNEGPIQWIQRIFGRMGELLTPWGSAIQERFSWIGGVIYNGFLWIGQQIVGFINYLPSLIGQAYNMMVQFVQFLLLPLYVGIGLVSGALNSMGIPFSNFINWLYTLPGQAYNAMIGLGQWLYNGLLSGGTYVYNGLLSIWNQFTSFINWVLNLGGQLYNAAANAFNSFVNGIINSIPGLKGVLDYIRGLFPASPPKWGPLVDIYDWGGNMADAISSGFKTDFPDVVSSFSNQLANLKNIAANSELNVPLSSFALPNASIDAILQPSSSNSTVKQEITVKLEIGSIGNMSNSEAEEKGKIIGTAAVEEISKSLNQQMTDNGISTENSVR